MSKVEPRPPFPPFNAETAAIKARKAEDAWNNKNPDAVSKAYSIDSKWRNRNKFFTGRKAIIEFLTRKWAKEQHYKLIKQVWAYTDNCIAVRFAYEWLNTAENQWYRSYGNENWKFDDNGLMCERHASINDLAIDESDRKFLWEDNTRPENYPSLSELGL